jgi:uncharacterized membrane protein
MAPPIGDTLVSVGLLTYRNATPLLVAEAVLTVIALTPAEEAGEVAVTVLSEMIVKVVAGIVPKYTLRVLIKPTPVIVTTVPPVVGPAVGVMELITGDGWNSKLSD